MESVRYLVVRVRLEHTPDKTPEELIDNCNYSIDTDPTDGMANYVTETEILATYDSPVGLL
jgi:hypothetical protein